MSRLATLLIFITLVTDPAKIGKINRAKDEAKKAYLAGNYKTAAQHYRYLTDSLGVQEEEVLLNLAHAHFQLNDTAQARMIYERLTGSSKPQIKSTARQQLGVLSNRLGKSEEALSYFKEALKADPANNDARYNYELLKKKLDEQKKREQQPNQQQPNEPQQNENQQKEKQEQNKNKNEQQQKDRQNSETKKADEQKKQEEQQAKDQQLKNEQQKDEKKESSAAPEKQEQQKISQETAKMLLEAIKNQEMQYLQQNKRKPSKPKDKGKPDW